jgi:hypothetical protein
MSFHPTRALSSLTLALALALSVGPAGAGLAACGGPGRANITAGTMPAGQTFTGVWHSPQYGEMQMVQTGNQVVAEYIQDERRGRIQGTVQGDLLRFEWSERRELVAGRPVTTRGRGYFRFVVGDDTDSYIVGEWGHDDNETGGGPWRGVRDRRRRPRLSTDSGGGSTAGGDDGGGEEGGDDLDSPGSSSGGMGTSSSGGDDLGDL